MSHYWRSDTFVALEAAAEATAGRWPGYSAFARLLGQGLRKKALLELETFVAGLSPAALEIRWEFVAWLCGSVLNGRVVASGVAPYKLVHALVLPTLGDMRQLGSCPEAFLWAARNFSAELAATDVSAIGTLRDGLLLFPEHESLRRELASQLVEQVEYDAHHLHESSYIGDSKEDLEVLAEARKTIAEVCPEDPPSPPDRPNGDACGRVARVRDERRVGLRSLV